MFAFSSKNNSFPNIGRIYRKKDRFSSKNEKDVKILKKHILI